MEKLVILIKSSTIHGIGHIYSPTNRLWKCFWILLFLFGISGIAINILLISIRYLSSPVLISHIIDHERFIWPDLVFCNPGAPFTLVENSDSITHWYEVDNRSTQTKDFLKTTGIFEKFEKKGNSGGRERALTMSTVDPKKMKVDFYDDKFLFIGYIKAHSGIYFSREYEANNPASFQEDIDNFFTTQLVQIQNNIPCQTFHIDRSKTMDSYSIETLVFYIIFNQKSYQIFNSSYVVRSLFLYITNNQVLPRSEIILIPGFNNVIELEQSRYEFHGIKRHCRNDNYTVELYDATLRLSRIFEGSFEDCKKILSQELYVNNCYCYSPFLPIYKDERFLPRLCFNTTLFNKSQLIANSRCMVNVYDKYHDEFIFSKIVKERCSKYKHDKCNIVKLKIDERKEMMIDLWSKSSNERRYKELKVLHKQILNNNYSDDGFIEQIRENLIKLTIKRRTPFGDLYREENEYPFAQLLSDVGGLMGLWLGMSVVGLFEIFEFLYHFMKYLCLEFQKKPNKTIQSEEENVFSL